MRKLLFILVLLTSTLTASAQSTWSLTPQVGINVSYLTGLKDNSNFSNKAGISFGMEAEWRKGKIFGLSLGAYYSKHVIGMKKACTSTMVVDMGQISHSGGIWIDDVYYMPVNTITAYVWGNDHTDVSLVDAYDRKYNYRFCTQMIDIPIMANFHVWKGLTLKGGLMIGVSLSDKVKYDEEYIIRQPALIAKTYYPQENQDDKNLSAKLGSLMSNNTISIPIGISYEYKNIVFDVRYAFALTKYGAEPDNPKINNELMYQDGVWPNEIKTVSHARLNALSITIGYRLNL